MAANKFKMVATEFKHNKFYLKHPKAQVEGLVFTGWVSFLMFVIIDIDTQIQQAKQFKMRPKF